MSRSRSPRRLRSPPLYRLLNRFNAWKELARRWRGLRLSIRAHLQTEAPPVHLFRPGILRPLPVASGDTLFGPVQVADCIRRLRDEGVWPGLQLPPAVVEEIRTFAAEASCSRHPNDPERFTIAEVCNGRSPAGAPVAVADVNCTIPCAAIDRVAADPLLIEITESWLGYRPQQVKTRLYWSPVSDLPDDLRRENGQTVDFHYDIEPANALYVFFYITAADRQSGAHITLTRSHRGKSLPMIFSSSFQPEDRVLAHFGAASQVILEGDAGFGFLEDPATFHKALPPQKAERLVLQFRYS